MKLSKSNHSIGPLLVSFGGLLTIGDVLVIGLTLQQHFKREKGNQELPEQTTGMKTVPP